MSYKEFQNKIYNEFFYIKKVMKSCKTGDQANNVLNWYYTKVSMWSDIISHNYFHWMFKYIEAYTILKEMDMEIGDLYDTMRGKANKVGF